MKNKDYVMKFIKDNFIVEELTLTDYPLFSGGVLVKDKNNQEMLFYYDILEESVKFIEK